VPASVAIRSRSVLVLVALVALGVLAFRWIGLGERARPQAELPVYGTPSSFCLEFGHHSFAQQVEGLAGASVDLRPTVAQGAARFLRRASRTAGTPTDLRMRLAGLAGALALSARTGDFDEARRLAAELDERAQAWCR